MLVIFKYQVIKILVCHQLKEFVLLEKVQGKLGCHQSFSLNSSLYIFPFKTGVSFVYINWNCLISNWNLKISSIHIKLLVKKGIMSKFHYWNESLCFQTTKNILEMVGLFLYNFEWKKFKCIYSNTWIKITELS